MVFHLFRVKKWNALERCSAAGSCSLSTLFLKIDLNKLKNYFNASALEHPYSFFTEDFYVNLKRQALFPNTCLPRPDLQ